MVSKHLSLITLYCIGAFISLHPQPIMSSARTGRAVLAYAIIASLALSAAVAFLVYDGDLGWGWFPQLVVLAAFVAGALLCATAPEGKLFDRLSCSWWRSSRCRSSWIWDTTTSMGC